METLIGSVMNIKLIYSNAIQMLNKPLDKTEKLLICTSFYIAYITMYFFLAFAQFHVFLVLCGLLQQSQVDVS